MIVETAATPAADWPYPDYYREWLDELVAHPKRKWRGWSKGGLLYAFRNETGLNAAQADPIFKDYCKRNKFRLPFAAWGEIVTLVLMGLVILSIYLIVTGEKIDQWLDHRHHGGLLYFGALWYLPRVLAYSLRAPRTPVGTWTAVVGSAAVGFIYWGWLSERPFMAAAGITLVAVAHLLRLTGVMRYRWYGLNAMTAKRHEMTMGSAGFIAFILFFLLLIACAFVVFRLSIRPFFAEPLLIFAAFFFDYTVSKLDAKDENGFTPLMVAVIGERTTEVRKLLAVGANPNIKSRDRRTALDFALASGDSGLIAALQAAGAVAAGRSAPSSEAQLPTGESLTELNQHDLWARKAMRRAVEWLPDSGDAEIDEARFQSFDAAFTENDLPLALDALETLGKQFPPPADFWCALEDAADHLGQAETAIRCRARAEG